MIRVAEYVEQHLAKLKGYFSNRRKEIEKERRKYLRKREKREAADNEGP